MNSFLRGLGFGAGFSISVIAIFFVFSKFYDNDPTEYPHNQSIVSIQENTKFRNLPFDDQIHKSTALVICRYSDADDGGRIAKVAEIFKDDDSISLEVNIGDERADAKYYPDKNDSFMERTGTITLYTGTPAKEASTYYLYNDRVPSFGDMPLELLIKKFNDNTQ